MSKIMPKSTKEEKFRWIKPILAKEITIKQMAKICPFSERSLKYWLFSFKKHEFDGLENKSTRPKSHPNETPIRIKNKILDLRQETRLSAIKLKWTLEKDGLFIHERTIGKLLKKNNRTRKYRIRKIKYKYIKAQLRPGELVEIDIKYVPEKIGRKRYYQFTAIDCSSRWRYLSIYDDMGNGSAINFLNEVIKKAPFEIGAVKTDNGSCFTNRYTGYLKSADSINPKLHALDIECEKLNIVHYLIDPGKPAQNGTVERSHRSDQEGFYERCYFKSLEDLKYKLRLWNMYYNNLCHCGLNGQSPNEALGIKGQNVYT